MSEIRENVLLADREGGICCPKCGGATRVSDSRGNYERSAIRRRRRCLGTCHYRFSTYELMIDEGLSPQGMLNLITATRSALDTVESAIRDARNKLCAVETAQQMISGVSKP